MLIGDNVSAAWKCVLKVPELYVGVTPEDFMRPLNGNPDVKALMSYLERRYWAGV